MKKIWDILAWIVLGLIAIWILLKVTGVINTPLWLQYSPLFGAIYIAGWAMNKLDRATDDIKDIKIEIKETKQDVGLVKSEIGKIKDKCLHCKD